MFNIDRKKDEGFWPDEDCNDDGGLKTESHFEIDWGRYVDGERREGSGAKDLDDLQDCVYDYDKERLAEAGGYKTDPGSFTEDYTRE